MFLAGNPEKGMCRGYDPPSERGHLPSRTIPLSGPSAITAWGCSGLRMFIDGESTLPVGGRSAKVGFPSVNVREYALACVPQSKAV